MALAYLIPYDNKIMPITHHIINNKMNTCMCIYYELCEHFSLHHWYTYRIISGSKVKIIEYALR